MTDNEYLEQRIKYFESLFDALQSTTSINDKRWLVSTIPDKYKDDFTFILECLAGMHKFGFTYPDNTVSYSLISAKVERYVHFYTIREILEYLLEPARNKDLSEANIVKHICQTLQYNNIIAPIINRTLKLGIGNSLLSKVDTSPMLAKKFEPGKTGLIDRYGVYITQKLDGNRCIAKWNGVKWEFLSRSGKPMHVNFDMTGYPKEYIYDGEVLSVKQTVQSDKIFARELPEKIRSYGSCDFNSTSGLINRHSLDKALMYNIFDIIDTSKMYCDRREIINNLTSTKDVRILPVLNVRNSFDADSVMTLLDYVTECGAEGLMINFGSSLYINKRTDKLLKVKKMKTIDMKVLGIEDGSGKYDGLVGALHCIAVTEDCKTIECFVGTGLSDQQREDWAYEPSKIIGKIVEVGYFEISQNSTQQGTNEYSLRFPRLIKVRRDKNETSEF